MDAFEYVMVLVSIVIGLAVTHLLNGLAAGVHRLRGTGLRFAWKRCTCSGSGFC